MRKSDESLGYSQGIFFKLQGILQLIEVPSFPDWVSRFLNTQMVLPVIYEQFSFSVQELFE